MTNVDDLDDITPSFPVIVEYTYRHVVWVEADSPADAAKYVEEAPYEHTHEQDTLSSASWSTSEPDRWDWYYVYTNYSDGNYTTEADAHVEVHRAEMRRQKFEAERAACTAEGHPDTESPLPDGRVWCKKCSRYLQDAGGGDRA